MSKSITIPIGQREPREYLTDLHFAISEVLKLVFEHRENDLQETQNFSLFVLVDLQQRVISDGAFVKRKREPE